MPRRALLALLLFGMMAVGVRAQASALAYVLSNGAAQLTIFDLATRTAPRSLPTGVEPAVLLIHPNNRLAFVSNAADNTVTFFDLRQEQVLATVPTGTLPGDMVLARDGKTLYVANEGTNDVTVIDVVSHSVVTTIAVGTTPVALNVSPDGRTVYAVNFDSASVSLIDTATNSVRNSLAVGSQPNQFALSPDLRSGFVVNTASNTVTQVDLASETVAQTILVGTNPVSIAFSPDSSTIYVINRGTNTVSVVRLQPVTQTVRTIPVGNSPVAMALTSDGLFGFLTNSGSNTVSVIDIRVGTVEDTIQLPTGSQPFAITLDPNENFVFVTNLGSNTVSVIDANTDAVLGPPVVVGQAPTQFSFLNAPSLFALQPASGLTGGTTVLAGEGFLPDSVVFFGTDTATSQFVEHDSLRATVPQLSSGPVNVLVRNPDLSTTDTASFNVVLAPTIAAGGVTPSQGPTISVNETQVSIAGSGFQNGALVSFGASVATVLAQGTTSITVTLPPGPPGTVDVAVVNPDGTRAVMSNAFTYIAPSDALPVLQVSDTSVQFVARSDETRLLNQSLGVMNYGSGSLNWTANVALTKAAPTNWLSVNPGTGGAPQTLVVRADPTGLPAGDFTGKVFVTANTNQVVVNVTLTILPTTSTDLVLPHLADGGGLFITTLVLVNPNDADAHATLLFRDDDGLPLRLHFADGQSGSLLNLTVPARGARFLPTDGSSVAVAVGSAEISSDLPIGGTAIFRQRVAGRPDFEAAVALVAPASKLVLSADDVAGFASGVAVMNPNDQTKTVRLRIRDAAGPLFGQVLREVLPHGHFSHVLRDLLPTVVGRRTTVEISSTDGSPLAAVGIRANSTGALTTLPVENPSTPSTQSFLAQVADGTESFSFRTTFLVFNPANFSASTRMDFFDDSGAAFVLGFVNGPTGSSLPFPIPPVALLAADTNAANNSVRSGQGRVTSDLPVAGTAVFRQQVSGRPDFEAAVPLAQPAADVLLLVDNLPGFNTGVAVGNAGAQAATLTLTFRDETGVVVAQTPLFLAANGHSAFILKNLMSATDLRRGVLEIVAPAGATVSAIGIRAQDSGALTTLPVLPR